MKPLHDQRPPVTIANDPSVSLEKGRECFARRAWRDAWQALSLADQQTRLSGADLEQLAMSAYLLGRDDDYLLVLDRAHSAHLAAGDNLRAVRCAFWLGTHQSFRGEIGHATGWFSRAQRLLDRERRDCVELGYLSLQDVDLQLERGDFDAAFAAAARAAEIGDRFAEADLSVCAHHLQGRILIAGGQVARGLALLDEAMLAVANGELSPIVTGLTYCSVIDGCQQAYALSRACEWTDAMTRWCAEQPDMLAFNGVCLAHRAELLQFRGAWTEAIAAARHAVERCEQVRNRSAAAAALYQQAEVHRLRGAFEAAEDAYLRASESGRDPQPGLALLRAAQGRMDAAATAIEVAERATTVPCERAKLLPACVEIMLGVGRIEEARGACSELDDIAKRFGSGELDAMAATAHGALALAEGDAQAALLSLRRALQLWQTAKSPYCVARVRVLCALACRALGDAEGGELELEVAKAAFEQLGAAPDVAHIDALANGASSVRAHGLTARQLQVLRLVASGKTNKAIAAELFVSEKTVDRHVSNIFAKLDVASRAAATARAYEYKLI